MAAALVTVVSCEQASNDEKPNEQPNENPILSTTTGSEMSISFIGETCDVEYTLTGVSEGKKPEASATEAWVKNVTVGESITFEVEQNTTTSARSATLKVWYADKSFEVALNQEAGLVPTVEFVAGALNGESLDPYAGLYNYSVVLSKNGITGWGVSHIREEEYYHFDIFSTEPYSDPLELPCGTYKYTHQDGEVNTFSYAYSVLLDATQGNPIIEYHFTKGAMKVTEDRIEVIVQLNNEAQDVHRIVYEGSRKLDYNEIPRPDYYTTLTEDYTINTTGGAMYMSYYGDFYGKGFGSWVVSVVPDGAGDLLTFDISTESTEYVESAVWGEYNCIIKEDDLQKGSFLAGDVDDNNQFVGSWYFVTDGQYYGNFDCAPLVGGKITIDNVDNSYIITLDCEDDLGNKITGTYTCMSCTTRDATKQ